MAPAIKEWIFGVFLSLLLQSHTLFVTLQRFKESPDLYYDHVGEAQLYNTEWKIVTYINLQEADRNLKVVRKYAQLSLDFCNNHAPTQWVNLTNCMKITNT
jgi:hypothetical protein